MRVEILALLVGAVATLIIFIVNLFAIYLLTGALKIGKPKRRKKRFFKKAMLLAGIAAITSYILSMFATFFGKADYNLFLNLAYFVVNTGILIFAGMKIYEEKVMKIILLWAFVFFIDFIVGILISAVLNVIV